MRIDRLEAEETDGVATIEMKIPERGAPMPLLWQWQGLLLPGAILMRGAAKPGGQEYDPDAYTLEAGAKVRVEQALDALRRKSPEAAAHYYDRYARVLKENGFLFFYKKEFIVHGGVVFAPAE